MEAGGSPSEEKPLQLKRGRGKVGIKELVAVCRTRMIATILTLLQAIKHKQTPLSETDFDKAPLRQ